MYTLVLASLGFSSKGAGTTFETSEEDDAQGAFILGSPKQFLSCWQRRRKREEERRIKQDNA